MGSTGSRHSAAELFTATGERRQIYALDTRLDENEPLFRLEMGEANAVRGDAKAGHLVCPIPGCADVRYTTRAGSRRDHFVHRHRGGSAHAPETWFHYTGKRLVGAWAAERYPEARVVVDKEAVSNGQVPDVLVEFPDGRRFAFEIQYAALTQDDWTWRHAGYAIQGIVDVWLFGHLPRYLRRDYYFEDNFVIGPLMRAVIAAGARPFWINPDERLVGSRRRPSDESWRGAFEHEADPDAQRTMTLAFDALADCRIEGSAFVTSASYPSRTASWTFSWVASYTSSMYGNALSRSVERVAASVSSSQGVAGPPGLYVRIGPAIRVYLGGWATTRWINREQRRRSALGLP